MNKINDFTDLEVWKEAQKLKIQVYNIVKMLPPSENFNLSLQIRRCVISITANIAEGFGRFHINDSMQFVRIARGSLFELKDHILSCITLKLLPEEQTSEILDQIGAVGRLMNGYLRYLRKFARTQ